MLREDRRRWDRRTEVGQERNLINKIYQAISPRGDNISDSRYQNDATPSPSRIPGWAGMAGHVAGHGWQWAGW